MKVRQCVKCEELKPIEKFSKKSSVRCVDCLNTERREQRLRKKTDIEYQLKLALNKATTLRAKELGKQGLSLCYSCGAEVRAYYENMPCKCGGYLSRRWYFQ